jgi:S-adenosylmethionine-diacylglycerol 3-amino-3-carboxypropyl transferase
VALQIGEQDTVFSITSGGCNTLAFLLDNPKRVIALDLSPYQNFLLELKIAAFRTLGYDELLEFLGVTESPKRGPLYSRVRESLSVQARCYWDGQIDKIERGLIHCGRYERYMRLLLTWLRRLVGRPTLEKFFECEDREARVRLFSTKWKNAWWWIFTRVLLSRATMTLLFDKAFFRYLDSSFSFGKHFAARAELALTRLPIRENSFLSYILRGCYPDDRSRPLYLRKENYETIRDRVGRIEIVTESCDLYFASIPASHISKFNFSNIFEWMSQTAFERLLGETVRVATDGAIITYRNLLVKRERPEALAAHIRPLRSLANALYQRDLSFIYTNYVVEQIQKEVVRCHTQSELSRVAAR